MLYNHAACEFLEKHGFGDSSSPMAFWEWNEALAVPQARAFSDATVFGMMEQRRETESINPPFPNRGTGRPLRSSQEAEACSGGLELAAAAPKEQKRRYFSL